MSNQSDNLNDIETVLTCLEDDAARLLDVNPNDEIAHNMQQAAALIDDLQRQIAGRDEVLADKRRLTRALDVAMHGEEGAAKQASLCDLIEPARRLRASKDGAYEERTRCAAMAARMALAMGLRAGIARTAIEGWDPAWHGCLYIDLPTGQVSWHYHESQAALFEGLPSYVEGWDGHDTPEKYRRVDNAFRKGRFGGLCNRTACQAPGATWFNHSTRAYYCASCAKQINEASEFDAVPIYGHDLCTPGEHTEAGK